MKDQDLLRARNKLKKFFSIRDATDATVEILEKFIVPFVAKWQGHMHEDEAIEGFFASKERRTYDVVATRDFKMPGKFCAAGQKYIDGFGKRNVKKGDEFILVVDGTRRAGKLQGVIEGSDAEYFLEEFELKTVREFLREA